MVTQNAQLVANSIMAEAIENWLRKHEIKSRIARIPSYKPEELVARGFCGGHSPTRES